MKEQRQRSQSVPSVSDMTELDVRGIRYKLGQSQPEFASMIGVSLSTLLSWEEGRTVPDGPALALLRVTAKNPKIVAKTLGH